MSVFYRLLLAGLLTLGLAGTAAAQDRWLQIEAQPSLTRAQESASGYAQRLPDVNGFRLGSSSWYAIVLGPFGPGEAAQARLQLRQRGLIPSDAFTTDGANFGRRFWPIGARSAADDAPASGDAVPGSETATLQIPESQPAPADEAPAQQDQAETQPAPVETVETVETPAEARRSEAQLSEEERYDLQRALKWAGVYSAGIDGAFGRGTRAAMGDWQAQNGYEVTGILTTRQRAALMKDYNAILSGLGLERVRDDKAGIEMLMPKALVAFEKYEPPFAHYSAKDDGQPYKVLLISQRGDRDTLYGLYDIMQTLQIVPQDGPRSKTRQGFTLEGRNDRIVSHTEASVEDGAVKGFTLIWPAGDEERRERVLAEMQSSFRRLPGTVLPDVMGEPGEDQSVDLLSGLQIRRPELSRSGFYVDGSGAVLTTSDVLRQCRRITLNDDVEAEVQAQDDATGLALLTPREGLAPLAYARFQPGVPRLQSQVAVSGFSYQGVLGAPTLTYGKITDLRGLSGEDTVKRLEIEPQPGDAGGPVLDSSGSVLGMLLPRREDGRKLPDSVAFAADVETISQFLSAQGLPASAAEGGSSLNPEALTTLAADMTVLVSCWN